MLVLMSASSGLQESPMAGGTMTLTMRGASSSPAADGKPAGCVQVDSDEKKKKASDVVHVT